MSTPREDLSEEIERVLDTARKFAAGEANPHDVPGAACAEWRDARANGDRPADIAARTDYSVATVRNHTRGRCAHGQPEADR